MKLDELDNLRWQNANMRVTIAVQHRDALGSAIAQKYGLTPGARLEILPDGTLRPTEQIDSGPEASDTDKG